MVKVECYECEKKVNIGSRLYCSKCKDKYGRRVAWGNFFLGLFVGLVVLLFIFTICGAFDSLMLLDVDKDKLVSDYVKGYYSEFENCTIEYNGAADSNGWNYLPGAEIYCFELDNRDAMRSLKANPDETIVFESGLTLNKIFKLKLKEVGLI